MYCSHCGCVAAGNFCSHCGTALAAAEAPPLNWDNETRYAVLMTVPQVRSAIQEHARLSRKKVTGEQFLALCEKIIPGSAPLGLLASIIQPLYASWGIGTGKQRAIVINAPVGRTIVRVLCSLAKNGQEIRNVEQATDGCLIQAALPSDLWSFEGELLVGVRQQGALSEVQAATKIKGQLFDWGKSSRCLDRLLADLAHEPLMVSARHLPRVA